MGSGRIDTPQNTKIVYLYVEDFNWEMDHDREINLGHPHSKRVYRGVFNTDTKTYRLIYDDKEGGYAGIFFPRLIDNNHVCQIDAKEINVNNILDFDISEEDLDKLASWLAPDGNKKLLEQFWGKTAINEQAPRQLSIPMEMVQKAARKVDPEMMNFVDTLRRIRLSDPGMFAAIVRLATFLLNNGDDRDPDAPLDPNWIRLSKDHGLGANLSEAFQKLARYSGGDRRNNQLEEDLLGAVRDLLIESIRRDFNDIED